MLAVRAACPICRGIDTDQILDFPYSGDPIGSYLEAFYAGRISGDSIDGRYTLRSCTGCGLIYQEQVPQAELLKLLYEEGACDGAGGSADVERSRGLRVRQGYSFQVEQMLKGIGKQPADTRVLDFGMGWGSWLRMARAYGCDIYGAELSSTRVEAAEWPVFGADDLPSAYFDFINTEQVFEHLVDPLETAQRLAGCLRPGGLLRVSVPNGSDVRARLESADWTAPKGSAASLNAVAPLEHLNCFDGPSLLRLGREAGLQPYRYPLRQSLDPWERTRFVASALIHAVRRPVGTMLLFRRPA